MKPELFNPEPDPPSQAAQVVAWVLIACLLLLALWPFVLYLFTVFV